MEIKPGKYRTRDNRQAVVLEVFEGRAFGRVKNHAHDGASGGAYEWREYSWCLSGNFSISKGFEAPSDLVSEWEEPKPRLRVWRSAIGGEVIICQDKPSNSVYATWVPVPELDALFEAKE